MQREDKIAFVVAMLLGLLIAMVGSDRLNNQCSSIRKWITDIMDY